MTDLANGSRAWYSSRFNFNASANSFLIVLSLSFASTTKLRVSTDLPDSAKSAPALNLFLSRSPFKALYIGNFDFLLSKNAVTNSSCFKFLCCS